MPRGAAGLAVGPIDAQLSRLGHEPASIQRATIVTMVALVGAARWPRWSGVALVGATAIALLDRSVPPSIMLMLAAAATSAVTLPPARTCA